MNDWLVIITVPGGYKKLLSALAERKIEAYAPMETVWRGQSHGRRSAFNRPLIPGYVFAKLGEATHLVHDLEGASRLLSFGMHPSAVPEAFLAAIRAAEDAGAFDRTKGRGSILKVGQRIRVKSGPYAGYVGALMRLSSARKVKVTLDMLRGGKLPATLDLAQLEAA